MASRRPSSLRVAGILVLVAGLVLLFNPRETGDLINWHRLVMGATFSIMGSVLFASAVIASARSRP